MNLLELKPGRAVSSVRRSDILIEPFGIETWNTARRSWFWRILIEPFGIETGHVRPEKAVVRILIEPFGIETCVVVACNSLREDFN